MLKEYLKNKGSVLVLAAVAVVAASVAANLWFAGWWQAFPWLSKVAAEVTAWLQPFWIEGWSQLTQLLAPWVSLPLLTLQVNWVVTAITALSAVAVYTLAISFFSLLSSFIRPWRHALVSARVRNAVDSVDQESLAKCLYVATGEPKNLQANAEAKKIRALSWDLQLDSSTSLMDYITARAQQKYQAYEAKQRRYQQWRVRYDAFVGFFSWDGKPSNDQKNTWQQQAKEKPLSKMGFWSRWQRQIRQEYLFPAQRLSRWLQEATQGTDKPQLIDISTSPQFACLSWSQRLDAWCARWQGVHRKDADFLSKEQRARMALAHSSAKYAKKQGSLAEFEKYRQSQRRWLRIKRWFVWLGVRMAVLKVKWFSSDQEAEFATKMEQGLETIKNLERDQPELTPYVRAEQRQPDTPAEAAQRIFSKPVTVDLTAIEQSSVGSNPATDAPQTTQVRTYDHSSEHNYTQEHNFNAELSGGHKRFSNAVDCSAVRPLVAEEFEVKTHTTIINPHVGKMLSALVQSDQNRGSYRLHDDVIEHQSPSSGKKVKRWVKALRKELGQKGYKTVNVSDDARAVLYAHGLVLSVPQNGSIADQLSPGFFLDRCGTTVALRYDETIRLAEQQAAGGCLPDIRLHQQAFVSEFSLELKLPEYASYTTAAALLQAILTKIDNHERWIKANKKIEEYFNNNPMFTTKYSPETVERVKNALQALPVAEKNYLWQICQSTQGLIQVGLDPADQLHFYHKPKDELVYFMGQTFLTTVQEFERECQARQCALSDEVRAFVSALMPKKTFGQSLQNTVLGQLRFDSKEGEWNEEKGSFCLQFETLNALAKLAGVCTPTLFHEYCTVFAQLNQQTFALPQWGTKQKVSVNKYDWVVLFYLNLETEFSVFRDRNVLRFLQRLLTASDQQWHGLLTLSVQRRRLVNYPACNTAFQLLASRLKEGYFSVSYMVKASRQALTLTELATGLPVIWDSFEAQDLTLPDAFKFNALSRCKEFTARQQFQLLVRTVRVMKTTQEPHAILDFLEALPSVPPKLDRHSKEYPQIYAQSMETNFKALLNALSCLERLGQRYAFVHPDMGLGAEFKVQNKKGDWISSIDLLWLDKETFAALKLQGLSEKDCKALWLRYVAYNTQQPMQEMLNAWHWKEDYFEGDIPDSNNADALREYALGLPYRPLTFGESFADAEEIEEETEEENSPCSTKNTKELTPQLKRYPEEYPKSEVDRLLAMLALGEETENFLRAAISTLEGYRREFVGKDFDNDTLLQFKKQVTAAPIFEPSKAKDSEDRLNLPLIYLLAALRHATLLHTGSTWLRLEQVVCILLYVQGRVLLQIETGEGKTLILQMAALLLACQGKKVDVVTHVERDAIADCNPLVRGLGKKLGLSVQSRYRGESATAQEHAEKVLNADVLYIDVLQTVLESLYFQYHDLPHRQADEALLDEVDLTLDTRRDMSLQLAVSEQLTDQEKQDFIGFLRTLNELIDQCLAREEKPLLDQDAVEKMLQDNTYFQRIQKVSKLLVMQWMRSAESLPNFKREEDYILAKDEKSQRVKLQSMHKTSSGVRDQKSILGNGQHQLLVMRERMKAEKSNEFDPDSIEIPEISLVYAEGDVKEHFNRNYTSRSGATGSLGDQRTRDRLKKDFQAELVLDMPRAKREASLLEGTITAIERHYDLYLIEDLNYQKPGVSQLDEEVLVKTSPAAYQSVALQALLSYIEGDAVIINQRAQHCFFVHNGNVVYPKMLERKKHQAFSPVTAEFGVPTGIQEPGETWVKDYLKHLARYKRDVHGKLLWAESVANELHLVIQHLTQTAGRQLNTAVVWPRVSTLRSEEKVWTQTQSQDPEKKVLTVSRTHERYHRRFDFMPVFSENREAQFVRVLAEVQSMIKQGGNVLIFVKTILQGEAVYNFLNRNHIGNLQIYDDTPNTEGSPLRLPADLMKDKAAERGVVTLATLIGARAVDYDKIKLAIVMDPCLLRGLIQELGRVGRNGQGPAITRQIYNVQDMELTKEQLAAWSKPLTEEQLQPLKPLAEREKKDLAHPKRDLAKKPFATAAEAYLQPLQQRGADSCLATLAAKDGPNAFKAELMLAYKKACKAKGYLETTYSKEWKAFYSQLNLFWQLSEKQPAEKDSTTTTPSPTEEKKTEEDVLAISNTYPAVYRHFQQQFADTELKGLVH